MREDDSRYVLIVHLKRRSVIEQSFRQNSSRSDSYRCQRYTFCDISESIDTFLGRVLILIRHDEAIPVLDLNRCVLKAQAICGRRSTDGLEYLVSINVRTILHCDSEATIAEFLNFLVRCIELDIHATVFHLYKE